MPNWISYDTTTVSHSSTTGAFTHTSQDSGKNLRYTYGLHRRCSNTRLPPDMSFHITSSLECVEFPRLLDCHGENRYFCSMWRSVGFLMSFAVVIEGMTIAAFAILLAGGKQRREAGWGALAILTALAATVQAIGMALIVSRKQALRHPSTDRRRHTFSRMMSGSLQAGF